jgi:hypothetical protein
MLQLSLQGCEGVSEQFIALLTHRTTLLPSLASLDLGWANACSSALAEALSLARPHCEVTGTEILNT